MRNVVIAGISGGIGSAFAERLLEGDEAVQIWGLCRHPEAVRFPATDRKRIHLIPWDALALEPHGLAERLAEHLPADLIMDTVIYAAGILHGEALQPEKRIEDISPGALVHAFQVNAAAFPLLVQALLPWLRHRELKRVVAVSAKVGSISDNHLGGWYAYRASKAALNMLVRNLAIELPRRCRPVACVAVHPGTTRTRLSAPFEQSLTQLNVHDPADTAGNLIRVAQSLSDQDNGRFINWDGKDLPW